MLACMYVLIELEPYLAYLAHVSYLPFCQLHSAISTMVETMIHRVIISLRPQMDALFVDGATDETCQVLYEGAMKALREASCEAQEARSLLGDAAEACVHELSRR